MGGSKRAREYFTIIRIAKNGITDQLKILHFSITGCLFCENYILDVKSFVTIYMPMVLCHPRCAVSPLLNTELIPEIRAFIMYCSGEIMFNKT